MPDFKIVESEYNSWHNGLAATEMTNEVLDHPWYQTVIKHLPENFKGKILEIGCGRGDFSVYLSKRFPEAKVMGTDFSESAIRTAEAKISNLNSNLQFRQENAESLSFESESYDLIISCETMEHVFHPQLMANEIFRVLNKGGRCILTTENYFNGLILSWLQTWIFNKPFNSGSGIQPHENFMIFFKTIGLFKRAGFREIRTKSNHFQWLILPSVNPEKLCTIEFSRPFMNKIFKPFGRHFSFFLTK